MEPDRLCPRCGQAIPWGQMQCPLCSERRGYLWSLRRDAFLLVIFVLLIVLFAITAFAVRSYHQLQAGLAQDWFYHGEAELKAGRAEVALADFRNAVAYSPDLTLYRLRLAQALAATGRIEEARTRLLNLWEAEPGNATVSLELARLAARRHAVPEAIRFFHGAIYGEWNDDPVARRTEARLELVQFLLDSSQTAAARAELIALTADLPPDPSLETRTGELLLRVRGYDDAVKMFRQALTRDPHSAAALAGMGEADFETGHYLEAERYLERALQQDPNLVQVASMLKTTRGVLSLDPFNRRLREQERARRAKQDFDLAMNRLEACAAQRGIDLKAAGGERLQVLYQQANDLKTRVEPRNLSRDSVLLSNTMDVVFAIEQTTSRACGEPHGLDLALLLLAHEAGGSRP